MLETPLPFLGDTEGASVPASLPAVIDAHVHLFPDALFASIWQWFERFGWPIRYKLKAPEVVDFLLGRGIDQVIALHYAHKPGVARQLNAYMADFCRQRARVTGMATVFPGERDARRILEEAFASGLAGVKLHAHVQCFDMNGPAMDEIYQVCMAFDKPLIMHVGREPKSSAYPCDPYELCRAEKLETVLKTYPGLKVCVPHLGADEFAAYRRMLEKYANIWLDTTMTLADYLPFVSVPQLSAMRADRLIYGTDFPNLPYAWDREIKRLCRLNLPEESLAWILGQNAARLFAIDNLAQ
ncbi:MAG: amidohydrolase [Desulfobacterales bacterium]|nr:MAG: amidohydrolase [Desulfobacterales bacterium]